MSTRESSSRQRRRRHLQLVRLAVILIIAALVLVLIFLRIGVLNSRKLDVSFPYRVSDVNVSDDLSDFVLQTDEPFAADLVSSDSETGNDLFSPSQDEDERALLFNLDTVSPVYAHGIYDRIYPASLTKIMTALLVVENGNMNDTIRMEEEDFELGDGAQVSELDVGDRLSEESLFKLLLVYSANEAAMALARTIGGTVDNFVSMMNTRAQELGMTGTHFANPTGLHDENHYTTPYDIYLMMNEADKYPEFTQAASLDQFEVEVTGDLGDSRFVEESTDEYLTGIYSLPKNISIIASKTGTTDEAGSCLALIVQNEYGVTYCAIVTGAYDKDTLYGDMTRLLGVINSRGQ